MTRTRVFQLACGASVILMATAMILRGTVPSGPADFAGGFFMALAIAFAVSARLGTG